MSTYTSLWQRHGLLERNSILLLIGILIVIAFGGLVEVVPLFYLRSTIETAEGVRPYTPLELAGRDIYVREGCYLCHSQMIRPLRDEVERYGHYSLAPKACTITRSSGDRSARGPISRASAASTQTTGTAITCGTRAPWCPAR